MIRAKTPKPVTGNTAASADRQPISMKTSSRTHDSNWDEFLAQHPAGHHVQTSMWSRIKAFSGWSVSRLTVEQNGQIVGGAQLLIRPVKYFGRVGYVPKGPVVGDENQHLVPTLVNELRKMAAAHRLKALFVQPSNQGQCFEPEMVKRGFRACPVETAPTATVCIDLSHDLPTILGRMTKGMRNGIRRSQKNEILVRRGGREDLETFYRLLQATAARRGFSPFSIDYFTEMWDELQAEGCVELFLGELHDEPVSAQIVIPFGKTVTAKQIGWSGHHGRLRPNEALDWATITWAQSNGFQYYDLEGIERVAAQAIIAGRALPEKFNHTPTSYKLRLGGEVYLFPQAYCYVANPLLRAAYNRFGYRIANWPATQKAISRFRTR